MKPAPKLLMPFVVLVLWTFWCSIKPVMDFDLFFQMLIGQQTLAQMRIPAAEFYVYPALGEKAHFSAWLFGVLHSLAYRAQGFAGNTWLNAGMWSFALSVPFWAASRWQKAAGNSPRPLALAACYAMALGLAFEGFAPRMLMRAEVTLYMAWAVCLVLGSGMFLRCAWSGNFNMQRGVALNLYAMAFVAGALSWFHTTSLFVAGFILVCAAQGLAWKYGPFNKNLSGARLYVPDGYAAVCAKALVVALALMMLNPYGMEQSLPHLLALAKRIFHPEGAMSSGSGSASMINIEYAPVLQTGQAADFIRIAALSCIALLLNRGRRLYDALILGFFGYMAYLHSRNMGIFAVASVEPLCFAFMALSKKIGERVDWHVPRFGKQTGIALSACFLASGLGFAWLASNKGPGGMGGGFAADNFAVDCSRRLMERYPEGAKVWNFHHLGSYIAWASGGRLMPALDGHFTKETNAWPRYTEAYFAEPAKFLSILEQDGVTAAVIPAVVPFVSGYVPAARALAANKGWVVLGQEKSALCLAKRRPGEEKNAQADEIAYWSNALVEARLIYQTASFNAQKAYDSADVINAQSAENLKRLGQDPQKILDKAFGAARP